MDVSDGFVPITAMFYSVFHPTEGTKVIHQVPSGSIVPPENDDNRLVNNISDSSAFEKPLFDFDTVKNYVIPKPSLCNKLITLKIDNYRILGFPVNIYGPHYARNSFGFNFCFVFPYESDTTPYEGNIKRIGKMFRALEEQSQLLSKSLENSVVYYQNINHNQNIHSVHRNDKNDLSNKFNMNNKYLRIIDDWDDASHQIVLEKKTPGLDNNLQTQISSIESLIQQIYQDLNNYSECKIPIDASNSVDLKLFPISPPPPHVQPYDVPISLVKLDKLIDSLWDPTMLKIVPFINGVYSIAQISELSNANLDLTKECIRHLFHYKVITMLDIFQFSNRYAVTSTIGNFLRDPQMSRECQDYVLNINGSFSNLPLNKQQLQPVNLRRQSTSNSVNSRMNDTYGISSGFISPQNHRKFGTNNNLSSMRFQNNSNSDFRSNNGLDILSPGMNSSTNLNGSKVRKISLPTKAQLFQLYTSLNSNLSLQQWCQDNFNKLEFIDIRRFITFGVRNNIIYRVHSYPVYSKFGNSNLISGDGIENPEKNKATYNVLSLPVLPDVNPKENESKKLQKDKKLTFKDRLKQSAQGDFSSSDSSSDDSSSDESSTDGEEIGAKVKRLSLDEGRHENEDKFTDKVAVKRKKRENAQNAKALRLLKHTQHMDSICTSMKLNRREVLQILDRIGDIEMVEL